MRVSDALFIRLCEAFNRIDLVALPEVRHAVEAALGDVSDAQVVDALLAAERDERSALDRAQAAEAKLDQVREALVEHSPSKALAILDGDHPPDPRPLQVQLRLDDEAVAALTTLQQATGRSSKAEVLRDALGVYQSLHRMLEGQKVLALVDRQAGEMQELSFPTLAGDIDALLARSSVAAGVRAMQDDPEAELARVDAELTPEVMEILRRANEPSPWVEQLASEWERDADKHHGLTGVPASERSTMYSLARELRKRATEGR